MEVGVAHSHGEYSDCPAADMADFAGWAETVGVTQETGMGRPSGCKVHYLLEWQSNDKSLYSLASDAFDQLLLAEGNVGM